MKLLYVTKIITHDVCLRNRIIMDVYVYCDIAAQK